MNAELFLKRKERLLISAIRLLDEAGLAGVTTRELAKREGISEPAVYRHFDGKAEVLLAILERFAEFDGGLADTVSENGMAPLDAIRHVCDAYAGYYSGYPQIANVMFSMDMWKYDISLDERMKVIFSARRDLIAGLLRDAAVRGDLPAGTELEGLSDLLAGLVATATHQWNLLDRSYDLRTRVRSMLDWVLPLPGKDRELEETGT